MWTVEIAIDKISKELNGANEKDMLPHNFFAFVPLWATRFRWCSFVHLLLCFFCACVIKRASCNSSGPKKDEHVTKCDSLSFSLASTQPLIKSRKFRAFYYTSHPSMSQVVTFEVYLPSSWEVIFFVTINLELSLCKKLCTIYYLDWYKYYKSVKILCNFTSRCCDSKKKGKYT